MATPIFVLGWGRSGTTWLPNMLVEHSAIAGIHHTKHWGIHESAFFSRVEGRYGSLDNPANFIEFAQVMAASDYFRLAGADADFLYSLYPASYAEVFRQVMDCYAARTSARFWVEKTPAHTIHAEKIARYYPDARFIAMVRDVKAVMASRVYLADWYTRDEGRPRNQVKRWFWTAAGVLIWQHYRSAIERLAAEYPGRTLVLTYEKLTGDTESVMRQVCEFLNLEFEPSMLKSRYPANSSFTGEPQDTRRTALTRQEERWLEGWRTIAALMPERALKALYRVGLYAYDKKNKSLPPWFFKLLPNTPRALSHKLSEIPYRQGDRQ